MKTQKITNSKYSSNNSKKKKREISKLSITYPSRQTARIFPVESPFKTSKRHPTENSRLHQSKRTSNRCPSPEPSFEPHTRVPRLSTLNLVRSAFAAYCTVSALSPLVASSEPNHSIAVPRSRAESLVSLFIFFIYWLGCWNILGFLAIASALKKKKKKKRKKRGGIVFFKKKKRKEKKRGGWVKNYWII